ncbi:phosphotransferase enzyme family protein [Aspergillus tubingensis]|uniref:phosphotransferase enzyme family protein n=1 Tax=Aspergillus tubingensis TaxID=5068 RepID=UPI001579B8D5|nr:phosphotransferase enzyme family protein [Aspergillus tubingensis]GFN10868.1 phosphotransferase enzyme family protein [Aspergillus tubingensis]
MESVRLTPSMIPDLPNYDVKESSFFTKWEQLPSPKEVQATSRKSLSTIEPSASTTCTKQAPFPTVRQFHDWFTFFPRRRMSDPYSVPIEPYRYGLPDHCAIKFTHGDLHRSNIIVTSSPPYRVMAIIDWEQSGWLPAYWEVRKAQMSALSGEEWASVYLPMVLDGFENTVDSWWWYVAALGP